MYQQADVARWLKRVKAQCLTEFADKNLVTQYSVCAKLFYCITPTPIEAQYKQLKLMILF